MTVLWLLWGFTKEILFKIKTQQQLDDRISKNKESVLQRLNDYPFYQSQNYQEWESIPSLEKKSYLQNFEKLNLYSLTLKEAIDFGTGLETSGDYLAKNKNLTIGLSTGTSGQRSAFVLQSREIGLWAGSILAKILGWNIFRSHKIAFVFRTHSPLYNGLNVGWIKLAFFNFNSDLDELIKELNNFKPSILVSVPNFYSYYLKKCPQKVISPTLVISGADVLEDVEKKQLENYFGVTVTQIYQATEGFLGLTCPAGKIHLNEENYIIEKTWVAKNVFMPLVTDVNRKSQAVIKYQLDDLLIMEETPCVCGSPTTAITKIQGRQDQILSFQGSRNTTVQIFPDFLRQLISAGNWYAWNYRITQNSINELTIAVDKMLTENEKKELAIHFQNALKARLIENVQINITTDDSFSETSAKRKRIVKL
jgi:putative adenylate-forming enzyme